jgi:hypothetical protein
MGRACRTNGEKRNAQGILMGKQEGKRPLGRTKRRWVDNIKKGLGERECCMDCIDLVRDKDQWRALVNTVMDHAGKFLSSCAVGGFSRRAQLHEDDAVLSFFFSVCGECISKLIRGDAFDSQLGGICFETQLEH